MGLVLVMRTVPIISQAETPSPERTDLRPQQLMYSSAGRSQFETLLIVRVQMLVFAFAGASPAVSMYLAHSLAMISIYFHTAL